MAGMGLTWVGTGSAFNPLLGHTSFYVENGSARRLLVDCGATVPLKLLEQGSLERISDIAITHPHGDHIGGLELVGFYHYFALNKRGKDRPKLYVATDSLAQLVWEHALRAGMGSVQTEEEIPVDASLDTFFEVHVGERFSVAGLPEVQFFPTHHVEGMENYGLRFANGIFYSGDTTELPPHDPKIIFQDCQVTGAAPGDVHIGYPELKAQLPPEVRKKTYLVHLGVRYDTLNPEQDGFAGYVMPGQRFEFSL